MTETEVRLRCIEAAARAPMVHNAGPAAGVLEVARQWATWVVDSGANVPAGIPQGSQFGKVAPLGLPKK